MYDCYYISTLTPEQALQLEEDNTSSWGDNGTLPPLSQQTMTIPSTTGTTQVPVEGPPVFGSSSSGYNNTGGGSTYLSGSGPYESQYMQQVMQELSTVEANAKAGLSGGLPQGFYYFQGNSGGPESTTSTIGPNYQWQAEGKIDGNIGQTYNNYPNQQGYDNIVNKLSGNGNEDYPCINTNTVTCKYDVAPFNTYKFNGPGPFGYPEPTPLPSCTNGSCTLNVGSTWYQSSQGWPEGNSGAVQGIGVVDTIPDGTPSNPCGSDSTCGNGSSGAVSAIAFRDRYNTTLMRAAALLATPSRPASSVSSISHSISDFRDTLFVTPRSGSKVLSVPHASLMSYGFPMRSVSYHGRDQSYGGFANVLYDFDLERLFGLRSIVTPFVG
ncbi:MAG: hypothetical protein J6P19_05775, partial [Acetobacter sp.]|nr:hypothetical protein [Acetobacter sp.]